MERVRYIGIGREATYNETPPPAATFYVDPASISLDTPEESELTFEGGFGRAARLHRPGFYTPAGAMAYPTDIRTVGWLLRWALSGYKNTPAGTANPNFHEIWGDSEILLPSLAVRAGKDVFEHVVSGSVINSMELAVEGEWANLTTEFNAAKDSKAALDEVTARAGLPAEFPLAFHEVTASIAGVDSSAKVKAATLTVANNIEPESGRSIGSRYPRRMPAAARGVELSMQLWYADTAELERFWGGATGPADTGASDFALQLFLDAGVDGNAEFRLPRVHYAAVQTQPSGREELVQQVTARAYEDPVTLKDGATVVDTEVYVYLENSELSMA